MTCYNHTELQWPALALQDNAFVTPQVPRNSIVPTIKCLYYNHIEPTVQHQCLCYKHTQFQWMSPSLQQKAFVTITHSSSECHCPYSRIPWLQPHTVPMNATVPKWNTFVTATYNSNECHCTYSRIALLQPYVVPSFHNSLMLCSYFCFISFNNSREHVHFLKKIIVFKSILFIFTSPNNYHPSTFT